LATMLVMVVSRNLNGCNSEMIMAQEGPSTVNVQYAPVEIWERVTVYIMS